jgi:hypothetical protein
MGELNRHIEDHTRIHFSLSTDPALGTDLELVIIGATGQESVAEVRFAVAPPVAKPTGAIPEPALHAGVDSEEALASGMPLSGGDAESQMPAAESAEESRKRIREEREMRLAAVRNRVGASGSPVRKEAKQEQMQFEPPARGRFEKSEPTVVDGQDLDVPTFLRRKV